MSIPEDMTIGEIYRRLVRLEEESLTKDTYELRHRELVDQLSRLEKQLAINATSRRATAATISAALVAAGAGLGAAFIH